MREYWHQKELGLIEGFPAVYAEMAALYAEDPAAAAQYITDWTVAPAGEETLDECNTMFDELMLYMINSTDTLKYSFSYSTLVMGDTLAQEPFVPSLLAADAE